MSDLKKQVTEKMQEIKATVSNTEELEKVMKSVYDIVDAFSNQLLEVSRRQIKLEEKTEEIFEMLSNIEEELIQGMNDFVAECPYCGEDVADIIPDDASDFECPKCHNVIELEELFDEESSCGGNCGGCHGCQGGEDEE